jgi:hypothetical protein
LNIIKEIIDINKKLDYIINHIKGEKMLNPEVLQAELTRAESLIARSKSFIASLISRVEAAEANSAYHAGLVANTTAVATAAETAVNDVSTKFSAVFSDFENFLVTTSNSSNLSVSSNTTSNVVSNTTIANTDNSNNVLSNTAPSVPPIVTITPIIANTPVANTTESVVQTVISAVEDVPTRIRTDVQEVTQDVTRMVHNIDPRLLHTS